MRQIFAFLAIVFFLVSCSENDEEIQNTQNNDPLVTRMSPEFYSQGPETVEMPFFYFEYDNQQRLTKKIGGFKALPSTTGYSGFYTNEMYTSLVYNGNNVTVEDFSTSNLFSVPLKSKYYTLNSSSQIVKREIPGIYDIYTNRLEIYSYVNNKLTKITTSFPNMPYDPTDPDDYVRTYVENFYYDSNGNLTKSEYLEQHNGINDGEKVIRTFGNYDNSYNFAKRLYLLDGYFYGSISKNNFRDHSITFYMNDQVTYSSSGYYVYHYDSNGNIILE